MLSYLLTISRVKLDVSQGVVAGVQSPVLCDFLDSQEAIVHLVVDVITRLDFVSVVVFCGHCLTCIPFLQHMVAA